MFAIGSLCIDNVYFNYKSRLSRQNLLKINSTKVTSKHAIVLKNTWSANLILFIFNGKFNLLSFA